MHPENQAQHHYGPYHQQTQAEENRLRQRDAQRRRDEQWRAEQDRQARLERDRRDAEQRRQAAARQADNRARKSQRSGRQATKRNSTASPKPAAKSWSWLAAIIGLVAGLGYAGKELGWEPGGCWTLATFTALIAGRFYKQIIAVAVLAFIVTALVAARDSGSSAKADATTETSPPVTENPRQSTSPPSLAPSPIASPVAGAPAIKQGYAVTLFNKADTSVEYEYRWGDDPWESNTLEANGGWDYWWNGADPSAFQIRYARRPGAAEVRTLETKLSAIPVKDQAASVYRFVARHGSLGIASDAWQPGFPHPTTPNLVSAAIEGRYAAAPGYRLYSPGGEPRALALKEGLGIVGIVPGRPDRGSSLQVAEVIDGSSADRAGIEPGDWLLNVASNDAEFMTPDRFRTIMRGEVGSEVQLILSSKRTGKTIWATLTRE